MTGITRMTNLSRKASLAHLATTPAFDIIVIGGGATGLGVAVDAATRGLSVAVFESHDFGSGTSSRATKLVHGGVRYLAQGHIPLVREALRERSFLLANAPHNAHALPFVMPSYQWWEKPFYGAGLKAYDLLAGSRSLGATEFLSKQATLEALPGVRPEGLTGGVRYWDGQFNDARLAIDLARTAQAHGALMLNYCQVDALIEDTSQVEGKVVGVWARDTETGERYRVQGGCVINATGVWVDGLRSGAGAALPAGMVHKPPLMPHLVRPSRGVHLVVSQDFMPTANAMLIPKTRDGRVLFMVPWLGHLLLGTTDTPVDSFEREPTAASEDVEFILGEAAHYLRRAPTRQDVLSCWAGLRPLVQDASAGSTKSVSREHTIEVAANGLVTVTGGKWTTYRSMAEDVLAHALEAGLLPQGTPMDGITQTLRLLGADSPCNAQELDAADPSRHPEFVQFAVQHEFARTTADVLARRSRVLFLDARRAQHLSHAVSEKMISFDINDPQKNSFELLISQYHHCP